MSVTPSGQEDCGADGALSDVSSAGTSGTVDNSKGACSEEQSVSEWSAEKYTAYTLERGVAYCDPMASREGVATSSPPLAYNHGAVVVTGVPADTLVRLGFVLVDNLTTNEDAWLVVFPGALASPREPLVIMAGVRDCSWSATEVVPAPYGTMGWCHAVNPSMVLMEALTALHKDHARTTAGANKAACAAYLVLFTAPMVLARIPLEQELLALYDYERVLFPSSLLPCPRASCWLFVSSLKHEVSTVAMNWGADDVFDVSMPGTELAPGTDAAMTPWSDVWDALEANRRVLLVWLTEAALPSAAVCRLAAARNLVLGVAAQAEAPAWPYVVRQLAEAGVAHVRVTALRFPRMLACVRDCGATCDSVWLSTDAPVTKCRRLGEALATDDADSVHVDIAPRCTTPAFLARMRQLFALDSDVLFAHAAPDTHMPELKPASWWVAFIGSDVAPDDALELARNWGAERVVDVRSSSGGAGTAADADALWMDLVDDANGKSGRRTFVLASWEALPPHALCAHVATRPQAALGVVYVGSQDINPKAFYFPGYVVQRHARTVFRAGSSVARHGLGAAVAWTQPPASDCCATAEWSVGDSDSSASDLSDGNGATMAESEDIGDGSDVEAMRLKLLFMLSGMRA
jgi:hypothetical protein